MSFTASLDLNIGVFESIIVQQTLKVALHCHSRILLLDCRTMLTAHNAAFVFRSSTLCSTLWSDVNEFLHCSLKSSILPMTNLSSTLLVESTNSSIKDICATLLCRTRGFICASRLCLALEQSHKHILNVLHHSFPVPQSNAIALMHASSISSVISSA